jgi:hypothetical protein
MVQRSAPAPADAEAILRRRPTERGVIEWAYYAMTRKVHGFRLGATGSWYFLNDVSVDK